MEYLDVMVWRAARDWRRQGKGVVVATVVHTFGSSPRPVGSIMAMSDDGAIVGSVSGGCIEDDLVHQFASGSMDASAKPDGARPLKRAKYGVSADEAHRFGLPCGGSVELLLEHDPEVAALESLVSQLEEGRLVRREVSMADGSVTLGEAQAPEELRAQDGKLCSVFGPGYRMLLIGAGQLTEYLATMATFSGFAVTVCDPREEHRGSWRLPGVTMSTEMPDDVVFSFKPDLRSCVIALTHDPKLDDLALMEALKTDAFYVGAIGSRRNNDARRQRLEEHFDLTPEELSRLKGPVGIYIGSKLPPEIAVSVMAEVLAVKNGVALPREVQVAAAKDLKGVEENELSCVLA
ncbi:MAG: XdhC family protein [Comamonadaceae bacterium]|nr:MAG: XdhC family protein [Comamonadaceae bacterium]